MVLPAIDAGPARCDHRTAAAGLRERIPAALPSTELDRVIPDGRGVFQFRGEMDLVLGPQLEVAGVVALVQLLALVAGHLVYDSSALDRRAGVDRLRPAQHMLILMGRKEFVGARVIAAEREPA